MKTVQFVVGTRRTNAFHWIDQARDQKGIKVERRQKGYSNHGDLENLVKLGYLEVKFTGPRGGRTYHATPAGVEAISHLLVEA